MTMGPMAWELETFFIAFKAESVSRCPGPQAVAEAGMSGNKLTPDDRELVARAFQLLDGENVGHISNGSAASMLERLGFNVSQEKGGKLAGQTYDLKQVMEVRSSSDLSQQKVSLETGVKVCKPSRLLLGPPHLSMSSASLYTPFEPLLISP